MSEVLRCEKTGNPCGTDTLPRGTECLCAPCRASRGHDTSQTVPLTLEGLNGAVMPGGGRVHVLGLSDWRPRLPTAAEFAARRGRLWGTRDSTGEVTFWRYDHDPWPNLSIEWRPYSDNYDPESWPSVEEVGRD